jgi:hypothetical protein
MCEELNVLWTLFIELRSFRYISLTKSSLNPKARKVPSLDLNNLTQSPNGYENSRFTLLDINSFYTKSLNCLNKLSKLSSYKELLIDNSRSWPSPSSRPLKKKLNQYFTRWSWWILIGLYWLLHFSWLQNPQHIFAEVFTLH